MIPDATPKRHGENAEQAERRPRVPRSAPYDRAKTREMIRQSLDLELHTRCYDRTDRPERDR